MLTRKLIKYGLYGTVAIGGAATAVKQREDYNDLAVVRLSRTALTAIEIARTYRAMLYSQDWDTSSKEYIETRSQAHQIGAEKLLELCKTNRGVYIKIGQHVGALDYLLPNEYVTTMRVLHKDAPQNPMVEVNEVIREEFNKDIDELFDDFDPEPLGTASLAQVHKAKLKDGTVVAVKVQHHYVKKSVKLDMTWIQLIITTMSKIFPEFKMQWLIDETRKNIAIELDFIEEGKNSERAAAHFKDYKWLKIPKVYWDYSTDRVLVMEHVTGGQINDLKYIEEHKIDKFDVCRKIGDLYSHMIFITGFVHGDPHPGNIVLKKDPEDKDVTICLLDHGLYRQLTEEFRYHYSKLWLSIIDRNKAEMKIHAEALGIQSELYGLFVCMVTGRPWDTIMKGISNSAPSSDEKSTFQKELPNILPFITQCLEHVDRQALHVLKTNDLVRSIEHNLQQQARMPGFAVMSQCCTYRVYDHEYKHTSSIFRKLYLHIKFGWTLSLLYLYNVYIGLHYKFLS